MQWHDDESATILQLPEPTCNSLVLGKKVGYLVNKFKGRYVEVISLHNNRGIALFVGQPAMLTRLPPCCVCWRCLFGTEDDTHNRPSRRVWCAVAAVHPRQVQLLASVVCPAAVRQLLVSRGQQGYAGSGCAIAASPHDQ